MEGTYHDVGKFVSYVANFPFIANISNMHLETKEVAASPEDMQSEEETTQVVGKKKETVTARFVLSTYYVKESERLEELTL
jgi:Tfp pilus assembly protein PilO